MTGESGSILAQLKKELGKFGEENPWVIYAIKNYGSACWRDGYHDAEMDAAERDE